MFGPWRRILAAMLICLCAVPATAGQLSLLGTQMLPSANGSLVALTRPQAALIPGVGTRGASSNASLFAGGFFAPLPPRDMPEQAAPPTLQHRGVKGLRELIARAEAGRADYDAVQHGARIRPSKRPTQMTIAEIYAWIDATPRQPHAIGRYQFIPKTLRRVVQQAGISPNARFSPEVQDALADVLFRDAGIHRFMAGELSLTGFMNNLAKIWAGFPNSSGRSHYHGYAGNKATISWAYFKRVMKELFPA